MICPNIKYKFAVHYIKKKGCYRQLSLKHKEQTSFSHQQPICNKEYLKEREKELKNECLV